MDNKLLVSLSPHVHSGDSVEKNMYGVLIALLPAFVVSLIYFGLGALIVVGDEEELKFLIDGGFNLNVDFLFSKSFLGIQSQTSA